MPMDKLDLHPRILGAAEKARLSAAEVICMSGPDLQRRTKLSPSDVILLQKTVAASFFSPQLFTAFELNIKRARDSSRLRTLSLGCRLLDTFLRGGILSRGLTEISGESGSGKTQLCLQLCFTVQLPTEFGGLAGGAVYISTEDVFPSKRLQQLIPPFLLRHKTQLSSRTNLGDNIFVEHAADVDDLRNIITYRLPLLLNRQAIKLVVVDSIAALFRAEFSVGETTKRAKALRSFGAQLHKLSNQHNVPVVCVNQVSDVISSTKDESIFGEKSIIPALGMAWSNMVTVRLMLARTNQFITCGSESKTKDSPLPGHVRRTLRVIFAPHLPATSCSFIVKAEGIQGISEPC